MFVTTVNLLLVSNETRIVQRWIIIRAFKWHKADKWHTVHKHLPFTVRLGYSLKLTRIGAFVFICFLFWKLRSQNFHKYLTV